jgi:hypothetical protein
MKYDASTIRDPDLTGHQDVTSARRIAMDDHARLQKIAAPAGG